MRTSRRRTVVGTVALAAGLVLAGAPVAASAHDGHRGRPTTYTCSAGEIPSGTYRAILVTGQCSVAADAVITVLGSVHVRAGAALDAQSAPSRILVTGDVTGARGSMVGLGCQPPALVGNSAHPCTVEPDGHSTITVRGSVSMNSTAAVAINGVTVGRNLTVSRGGSPIPWSIKNNTVGGTLAVHGVTVEWLGVMFNQVGRNVVLTRVTVNDVDPGAPGVYVVRNVVGRNLICWGLKPGVSGGFVPGSVNVVGGRALGQCASLV